MPEPRDRPEFRNRESTNAELIASTLERFGLPPNIAHRAGGEAALAGSLAPGVAEAMSARDAKIAFDEGNTLGGVVSSLGAVPFFGMVPRLAKKGMGLFAAARLRDTIARSRNVAQETGDPAKIKEIFKSGRILHGDVTEFLDNPPAKAATKLAFGKSINRRARNLDKFGNPPAEKVTKLPTPAKKVALAPRAIKEQNDPNFQIFEGQGSRSGEMLLSGGKTLQMTSLIRTFIAKDRGGAAGLRSFKIRHDIRRIKGDPEITMEFSFTDAVGELVRIPHRDL